MNDKMILIVDDESRIRKLIKDFIEQEEYSVLEAADGEEAVEQFESNINKVKLVILDVMMPKQDGWSALRQIRQISNVPVIMLTADEYVSKPFSPKILIAKIKAILQRTSPKEIEKKNYDGIEIDTEGRNITVDGKQVELSLREYELLKYLLDNENVALSRDKILNNVWNYDYYGDSRTIDSHIKKIRHKLGKKGKYIKTMRGVGYKFEIK